MTPLKRAMQEGSRTSFLTRLLTAVQSRLWLLGNCLPMTPLKRHVGRLSDVFLTRFRTAVQSRLCSSFLSCLDVTSDAQRSAS
ncbi:hypothetical protein NDU88_006317 [Pleurodeles waltl]|uniref:Secreted protein n=1 Tax=Pleurodeles waltl TaxID=8319 RepID=A0AAV7NPZ4_PLEWA|nr:hypothetical protein NDU88_006317 [Pleurodeles waltl]